MGTATAILVGVVEGDDVTLNDDLAEGVFAEPYAGPSQPVTVSGLILEGTDADSYSLTQPTPTAKIVPKELTVEGILARWKEYDGTTEATLVGTATAILVGVVEGDDVKLAIPTEVLGTFTNADVGDDKSVTVSGLSITGAEKDNYTLVQPTPTAKIISSIQRAGIDAEMNVKGNGVEIADGKTNPSIADFTNFGSADIDGDKVANTFTIHNSGNADLTLNGAPIIVLGGNHSSDFTVTDLPESTVSAGSITTFEVTFNPSATGTRWGTLSISNNDTDENPYTFSISGFGKTKQAVASPVGALPSFTVNNLNVSPVRVESGEEVSITVEVINIGKVEGIYDAVLTVNGVVDTIRQVTVSAGESVTLSFTVTRSAGSYEIDIGGQETHFEVISLSRLEPWWFLIGLAIVPPIVLLLLLARRRRSVVNQQKWDRSKPKRNTVMENQR